MQEIQKVLDEFNFKGFSNLDSWVGDLEEMLENVLQERLIDIITTWINEFENYRNKDVEKKLVRENTFHEIIVSNQTMAVSPAIEYARTFWMTHFHACLGIVCNLPRLDAHAYTGGMGGKDGVDSKSKCFHNLLGKIDKQVLRDAYGKIKEILHGAEVYVETWLSYQGLWEIDINNVYESLGDDIEAWQRILNDIKNGRGTFDNSETEI